MSQFRVTLDLILLVPSMDGNGVEAVVDVVGDALGKHCGGENEKVALWN